MEIKQNMEDMIRIQQEDGYITQLFPFYTTAPSVVGSIVVLHGMCEHHERYFEFTHFLNKHGFDVYLYDHRGHGTDQKLDNLGFFANKDGYKKVIADTITVLNYVREHNRSNKLALFAHSMGSLIARNVIQQDDALDCVILSGSTSPSVLKSMTGRLITSTVCLFRGKRYRSNSINQLLFGSKKYTSLCKRTTFDWLTRNNTLVGAYIHDPYCGFLCTSSFYHDLLCLAHYASKKKQIVRTRKDLPILFISGDKDPVSNYSKEITALHQFYQKAGFTNVSRKLYPECRHELLNELNQDEIFQDVLEFYQKILN